ncbi:lytic murein transglycosylase [Parvularcula oceani]|uniref:lytic murein transglycosylase n=1 Tax=Parvularcula oceani TaxID=1247963 RepID=UPI0006922442|nr:lytic murein transglycosylase [Parvularcula oceani]
MRTRLLAAAMALTATPLAAQEAEPDFGTFREQFRIDAVAAGISPNLYDEQMATVKPLPVILKRNDNQPEFVRPLWDYVDGALSEARIRGGLEGYASEADLLNTIEAEYGVDAETLVAIWGMESSFGRIMGDEDVLSALSTLAYQGRRQSFGRTQLIAALRILQNGDARREQLQGSWAGAMGQTQFIPTTYLAHAVDHDGDGKKDLWSDRGDVFASTANYLSRSGYRADLPWGFEVVLPEGFDFAQADRSVGRSVAHWQSAGVTRPGGALSDRIDLNETVSIILPAGANGPAFLVTDNFRAILRYNNATAYALAVGFLSDAVAGRSQPLANDWPRDDRPLTLAERKALQETLSGLGYEPGPVDGIIGAGTRKALRSWQRDNGLPADGYASALILSRLMGA